MQWVLFSLLAASIFAVVNIMDKYILTRWVENPTIPVIILGTVGLLASAFIYLFFGFSPLSCLNTALALIAGVFYVLMCVFYFRAVKIDEISRVTPLFYLTPLFVSILAAIFLGEVFTQMKYLGMFLLVIGAVLISSRNFIKINPGSAFWYMLLASFSIAVSQVITKYLLEFADFWTVFSYIRIGAFFALIPILYFNFSDLVSIVRKHDVKVLGLITMNELLNLCGVLLITLAIACGYVTLVNALGSTQAFFVLSFTVVLSVLYPQILKEEISTSIVLVKLIAMILMFTGAILVI